MVILVRFSHERDQTKDERLQGILFEAHIKKQHGRWYLSLKYWKAPVAPPIPDKRILVGEVDTGINPHATDSEGQIWENPKAYYLTERKLMRW